SGNPLKMEFNYKEKTFYFEFEGDTSIKSTTTIYVPEIHYPNGFNIVISEGEIQKDEKNQMVSIFIKDNGIHTVKITKI
ncbi:MAG: hypothetical protein ACFFDF_12615, partial [Candidatus Odinarchaeota archaeon]